jgi:hypothetical protein
MTAFPASTSPAFCVWSVRVDSSPFRFFHPSLLFLPEEVQCRPSLNLYLNTKQRLFTISGARSSCPTLCALRHALSPIYMILPAS